jgi:hypothetical protein
VVPALYHLVQAGKLPDQFAVAGVDRNDQTTAQWRQNLTNIIQTLTPAGEIAKNAFHISTSFTLSGCVLEFLDASVRTGWSEPSGATCMPDGVSPSGLDAGAPPIDFLAAV